MYIPQRTYGAVRQESVDDNDEAFPCVSIKILKKVTRRRKKQLVQTNGPISFNNSSIFR
jgi:hypothetical protein